MSIGRLTLNDANIAQMLTTIVEHVQRLSDPAYTKKLRSDVLTLPEEVKTAQDNAQAVIAQAESLKTALLKQETDANEKIAQREKAVVVREALVGELNVRKSEAEAIETRNKTKEKELKETEQRLAEISKKHADADAKHLVRQTALDKREKELDAYKELLDKQLKDNQTDKQKIKDIGQQLHGLMSEQLKGLVEGL